MILGMETAVSDDSLTGRVYHVTDARDLSFLSLPIKLVSQSLHYTPMACKPNVSPNGAVSNITALLKLLFS